MKTFVCSQCSAQIYFDNTACMDCGSQLAFVPDEMAFMAFDYTSQGSQRLGAVRPGASAPGAWQPCLHRSSVWRCNWATFSTDPSAVCLSCRLTRLDLSASANEHANRWWVAEAAKRRLLATLLTLGLRFGPRQYPNDSSGLEFVWTVPGGLTPATTGHDNGTITLNLLEADDDHRESARVAFGEPLRSVLGHLRHELSHRLQQSHMLDAATQDAARSLFGDDRIDYTQALQMHYADGPPPDWQQRYISAYARARGKPESPSWKAKATVVLVLLDHHIEEEHSEMFTLIGTHFSPEQRNSMGQRCQHFTAQKNEPAMA